MADKHFHLSDFSPEVQNEMIEVIIHDVLARLARDNRFKPEAQNVIAHIALHSRTIVIKFRKQLQLWEVDPARLTVFLNPLAAYSPDDFLCDSVEPKANGADANE